MTLSLLSLENPQSLPQPLRRLANRLKHEPRLADAHRTHARARQPMGGVEQVTSGDQRPVGAEGRGVTHRGARRLVLRPSAQARLAADFASGASLGDGEQAAAGVEALGVPLRG